MQSNATLTDAVKNSIQIEQFIYHIIIKEPHEIKFNDIVTLSMDQKRFFEERIREACSGSQFVFTEPTARNTFKSDCTVLLDDPNTQLEIKSKELAQRFFDSHTGTMNDGVFIIAIISILHNDSRKNLLAFLKVDYSTVYQQERTVVNGKHVVTLQKIVNSLADSPKALQKWAVVDPSQLFSWDVLALQRGTSKASKDSNEAISSYFRNFLQVQIKNTPSALTKSTVSTIREWSHSLNNLPASIQRSDFKARSVQYFENNDIFDTDQFIEYVLGSYTNQMLSDEENQERRELRAQHVSALHDVLSEKGIAGQIFESRPNSIPDTNRKQRLKTNTGVSVVFEGTLEDNQISITNDNNEKVITIRTTQLDIL
ncbi:MAG: nucleoid-associated protein [Kangiella sp.]|nr:nucleoid-associated protein [Kangiella sp.]